MTKLKIRI